jgi:hypothetical protein
MLELGGPTLELGAASKYLTRNPCSVSFFSGFARLLTALLLVLPQVANASCDRFTIGMNKFDLALQYIGRASGGDGSAEYIKVTRAMARKAIDDASHLGVTYFRVSATGFSPSRAGKTGDLDLWLKDSARYWASIDQMMADLQAANICVIPVLVWNALQFPAMASEPLGALLHDTKSASWRLLERYVRDFVMRYRHSPNLLFYELTNELNSHADLDAERNCRKQKSADECALVSNFTTNDMNEFTGRVATLVRSLDEGHKISSGFTLPRAAAQHLRRHPQWSGGGADWTRDSADELETNLRDIHASVDIISVHLYPEESLRLGLALGEEFKIASIVQSAAARIGKPLFIGEFGQRDILHAPEISFISNTILEIEKLQVPYSAAWVWEFYQLATDAPYQSAPSSYSLEPGYTDTVIDEISQVNARRRPQAGRRDTQDAPSAPTVVLTKPLECATVAPGSELFAVASYEGHAVASVDFFIDGKAIGRVVHPPYRLSLPSSERAGGVSEVEARACSIANKCSSYKTRVVLGQNLETTKQCLSERP